MIETTTEFDKEDMWIRVDENNYSPVYTTIYAGDTESLDIEVYYKGQKVINVSHMTIQGNKFVIEKKSKTWKEKLMRTK